MWLKTTEQYASSVRVLDFSLAFREQEKNNNSLNTELFGNF
jgi:hypothetical protein